eukprot:7931889-Pyramimonas_sp.AAC.1
MFANAVYLQVACPQGTYITGRTLSSSPSSSPHSSTGGTLPCSTFRELNPTSWILVQSKLMKIGLVTPANRQSKAGNRQTAVRWGVL